MARWQIRGNLVWVTPACSRMLPLDAKAVSEFMIPNENYLESRPLICRTRRPNLGLVANA